MGQTLIERVANRYAVGLEPGQKVHARDYISIRPKHVMTHDNTGAVIPKFRSIGASTVFDARQPVFCIDHDIQNTSRENLSKYVNIEVFAEEHGIDFHPPGRGIGHQIMVEEGYVTPGSFVVGSDSHSNLYGGIAALGTPVVRTDAAAIWVTGQTWWEVPEIVRVELRGRLRPGVTGKDVIIALCGTFKNDEVLNCAVEFTGDHLDELSVDQRLSIANMTTEWGALAGVFPFDKVLRDYLYERADFFARRGDDSPRYTRQMVDEWYARRLASDPDAYYAKELTLDLDRVTPHVAGPNEVKAVTPLSEMERRRVRIDKAYLLSCVNGRFEDLAEAARILKGKRVAEHVKLYVAAASSEVERRARESGDWQALVDSGAITLPSGCGPCIGLGQGTLEAGEVGISATNRNFKGRMGSRDAQVYLSSPAVVAASAVKGWIAAPANIPPATEIAARITINPRPAAAATGTEIAEGFPRQVTGRLLLLPKDNLNTDGIYGKDYTYRDGLTPQEMGKVVMLNYDPEFQNLARQGDIIVGGRNFGSGSSREQAATAPAYRGIRMVIAASFSQTYKRNAFNNGFVVFECPELVDHLRARLAARIEAGELTVPTEAEATVDFERGQVRFDGVLYPFAALGKVPQELIAAGGTEPLVRKKLQEQWRRYQDVQYSKPSQVLVDEHKVIVSVLDAVEKVARSEGDEFEQEFFEKAFDFFPTFADKCHHAKEEAHLFPILEERGVPREGGPIGCMLAEHDEGRAHVQAVKRALKRTAAGDTEARKTVREEALAFVQLLRGHIEKENNVLFVVGDQAMTDRDKDNLMKKFETAEDEVLPPGTHEKYVALATELRTMAGL